MSMMSNTIIILSKNQTIFNYLPANLCISFDLRKAAAMTKFNPW